MEKKKYASPSTEICKVNVVSSLLNNTAETSDPNNNGGDPTGEAPGYPNPFNPTKSYSPWDEAPTSLFNE